MSQDNGTGRKTKLTGQALYLVMGICEKGEKQGKAGKDLKK
jgi:hypothetical protein